MSLSTYQLSSGRLMSVASTATNMKPSPPLFTRRAGAPGRGAGDGPACRGPAHVGRLDGDEHEAVTSDVYPVDLRLQDALRQITADLRHGVAHVIHGTIGWRANTELHEGTAEALTNGGVELVNAFNASDRRFYLL